MVSCDKALAKALPEARQARKFKGVNWSTLYLQGNVAGRGKGLLHQTVTQAAYLGARFADLDQRFPATVTCTTTIA